MKNNLTILIAMLAMHAAFAQCPQPTGVYHTNVTYYSVVINSSGGISPDYNLVEWGSVGFTPGTGGSAGVGGHVVAFNSPSVRVEFSTNQTIQYYVRQHCSSTGTFSPNSAPGSFTPLPCPYRTQMSVGYMNQWNFCSRGIVDVFNYSCTPNNYYGNEFIGMFNPNGTNYTINVTYHNNSSSSKKFTFLIENDSWISWCGPEGLQCQDQITVASGSSVDRRYSVNSFGTMEIWFDCDDSSSCSSVQYVIYQSCANNPPTSITASSNNVCLGSPLTLTQVGGTLPPGGNYYWYMGSCNGGTLLGTGSSITFNPTGTGYYYVRVEAPCGVSYCTQTYITVSLPVQISTTQPTLLCYQNQSAQLTAYAGNTNNTYQWLLNGNAVAGATNYYYNANQTGNWQCSVVNGCGTTVSNTIPVTVGSYPVATITANGPTSFCMSGSVTLTAATGTGYTYQWMQDGYTISGATNPSYVAVGNHYYRCDVTNNCGTSYSSSITVTVHTSLPNAAISSSNLNLCPSGSSYMSTNAIQGYTYQWRFNGNPISGATNSGYSATSVGNYDCIITNGCGSATSNVLVVVYNPGPAIVSPQGPTTFCNGGSVMLAAIAGSGITYQWSRNGVAITGATASTYIALVTGSYTCQITRCGSSATSNTVSVVASTGPAASISSSSTTICPGGSRTLNANTGTGITYQWRFNGANISGATSASYIATAIGSYDCFETNSCGSTASNVLTLTTGSLPSAVITMVGSTSVCQGSSDHLMANTAQGQTYQWKRNAVIISGATGTEHYPTVAGNYTCVVTNSCGSSTSNSITITMLVFPVVNISAGGATSLCQGGSVLLIASTSLNSTYQWQKNGVAISGATTDLYTATSSGSYTATIVNSCGTATSNAITVSISGTAPNKPGTITGPATFCSYQSGVVYSIAPVPTANSYNWLVPTGATVTSGQGTTSITVTFGNKSGNIRVGASNSCGVSAYQLKKATRTCRETEIEQVQNSSLEVIVFPNPASGPFTLKVSGIDVEQFTFKVFDLTGRCMETYESETGSGQIEFGNSLPAGIYMLEFTAGEERKLLRFVKQD